MPRMDMTKNSNDIRLYVGTITQLSSHVPYNKAMDKLMGQRLVFKRIQDKAFGDVCVDIVHGIRWDPNCFSNINILDKKLVSSEDD